ncbi:hypothetical protein DXG01_003463 [Tephrocybe rancida]|nr:hypothetical protein DXG01_003463 [Tephrocybe rancida]
MTWFYTSKSLTLAALDRLVHSVILAPDFRCEDFDGFSTARENRQLDTGDKGLPPFLSSDVWKQGSVNISLPFTCKKYHNREKDGPTITIHFYHRDLVEAFKSGVKDFTARKFHWQGFRLYWKPSKDEPEQWVYGEAYTSDQFLDLESTIIPVEGCNLERAIVPLMLYSDLTHLTNFGTASLWPLYFWFSGLSKYICGKVSSFSAHHLAYFPSLPDLVKDQYKDIFGATPSLAMITHLQRELIQAVWKYLLTDEFKQIYKEGIVVKCGDGVLRLGTKLHNVVWSHNQQTDSTDLRAWVMKARDLIFKKGYSVAGKPIDRVLGDSHVPVKNALSQLLLPKGQNYFDLFIPDIMHKFELGVWKNVFTHLIHMLHMYGPESVAELDCRTDINFEFQNAGPCFEGLFCKTSHKIDKTVQDLLFIMAAWHGSAKMCCYMDWSLDAFCGLTFELTHQLHAFSTQVCPSFATQETPKEASASQCRKAATAAKKAKKKVVATKSSKKPTKQAVPHVLERQKCPFHLDTPKTHSIVHYPNAIQQFGTTDSYSTQVGEQEHRHVKAFYARMNKNEFEAQLLCKNNDMQGQGQ